MKLVSFVIKNLAHRKLRTSLTILGIIIGIGAIVSLVSLGDSLKLSVSEQLEQLGPNRVMIIPSAFRGGGFGPPQGSGIGLKESDLNTIKKIRGVELAIPLLYRTLPVEYKGETASLSISAFPTKDTERFFSDVQTFDIEDGRYMSKNEKFTAVVGSLFRDEVFSDEVKLRSKIKISDRDVTIVGFFKPIGNTQDDTSIFMPLEGLRDILGNEDEITMIMTKVNSDPKKVAKNIEKELDRIHGEDTFTAMTTDQIIEQINGVFGAISLVFIGIAAISLLVAGFGIMNTMLMSVMERTRDIGTMKAIGATNERILTIFLAESAIVGLIGGGIGVIFGLIIYKGISEIAGSLMGLNLPFVISPFVVVFAVSFSILVGVLSGLYPAWRASKLNPVDALRYE